MLRDLFSLFPAYAGVIPVWPCEPARSGSFPRIRGGDPLKLPLRDGDTDFSPHTRG